MGAANEMTKIVDDNLVSQMPWDEVRRRLAAGTQAILPAGAAAKQHGLHMTMGTDAIQAERLALLLAAKTGALIWPPLTYGHYPAFAAYAGSINLSRTTYETVLEEIMRGILGHGARRVLLLDTGISTNAPAAAAISRLPEQNRAVHLKVWAGSNLRAAIRRINQQRHGTHADEMETSLMLALAPEAVVMSRAEPPPCQEAGDAPGPMSPDATTSPNYSPGGSTGRPDLATQGKGEILLEAILLDFAASV